MQIFLKDYVLILSKYAALTMLTSSISMSLSSAADNCLAFLREVSGFTDFVLTNKTASIALRLNFVLRTGFIKSNSTHDDDRLSINVSRISFDQWSRQSKRGFKVYRFCSHEQNCIHCSTTQLLPADSFHQEQ